MRRATSTWMVALLLCPLATGCAAMRRAMAVEASTTAARELWCGPSKVLALDLEDWAFRVETACRDEVFYRCGLDQHMSHVLRPEPHFDCHAHATEAEVVGLFHPADEPGHR